MPILVPNYEFKTQILKMGENALVVNLTKYKDETTNRLKATLNKYNLNVNLKL